MAVPGCGRLVRFRVRRHWKLLSCMAMVYFLLCVWMQANLQERADDGYPRLSFIPKAVYDPFGSAVKQQCEAGHQHIPIEDRVGTELTTARTEPHVCSYNDAPVDRQIIQMENEWGSISVGYPNLVLTVTGWVDTITVDNWTPKPLTVIIVPHSHQDPGWLSSFESYYYSSSRPTLSLIVSKLAANPTWKFVWAEVAFLQLWWNDATPSEKETFKRLVNNGQLEILTGGWVMTDEATAHYAAMLDQLSEGHLWLKDTLGLTVNNSWAIDPFGHSPTMTYLLGRAGMKNMAIQRTHFAVKRHFAYSKNLEFYWKQAWDKGEDHMTSVFCHMMPFLSYSIPHSCGPDRHVCCKFDFSQDKCFFGKAKMKREAITDKNVAQLSWELWEQLQKKSELFRSDVVLVPHGDDFRYSGANEWDAQFGNMGKIMSYINNNTNMNMNIKFGTLDDYFTTLHKSQKGPKHQEYPVLMGDFFPYSDRSDQYWSGFYTTRPYFKRMIRRLQSRLRATELLYIFALSKSPVSEHTHNIYNRLVDIRHTLALMQHHDAITGTSKNDVVLGYLQSIRTAITSSQQAQEETVHTILTDWYPKRNLSNIIVTLTESYEIENTVVPRTLIDVEKQRLVLVWNPLGVRRHDLVTLLVNSANIAVADDTGQTAKSQLSPVFDDQMNIVPGKYYLSFEITVGPLSLTRYALTTTSAPATDAFVKVTLLNMESLDIRMIEPFKAVHSNALFFHSSNQYVNATFSSCDGMLKSMKYLKEKTVYRSEMYFATYSTGRHTHPFRDKSGAYIFLPDGPAKVFEIKKPRILVLNGRLATYVYVVSRDILHIVTLFNVAGPLGKGLLVENVVQIKDKRWDNKELAVRLETDVVDSKHTFCHDLNGFQLHKRQTRAKLGIQGNYYPMTTMAMLDDDVTRVTLITTESHGVASLVSGMLEVMLDRRLVQDDWRGLRQGVTDNVKTRSTFFVMFEKRRGNIKVPDHGQMCYPSTDADLIDDIVNNPASTFILDMIDANVNGLVPTQYVLSSPLPCGMHIVNFKYISNVGGQTLRPKEVLLTVHMKQLDCAFAMTGQSCSNKSENLLNALRMKIVSVEEMMISGAHRKSTQQFGGYIGASKMEINTYKIAFR